MGVEMEAAKTVKDVSPHEFVKAYSSHLKRSGKVALSLSLRLSVFIRIFEFWARLYAFVLGLKLDFRRRWLHMRNGVVV